MAAGNLKVESGLQLLARLTKKPIITNFYPPLFCNSPKNDEIIEISGEDNCCKSLLLVDIACEALMPAIFGGMEANIIIFSTDGNFSFRLLIDTLREKIVSHLSVKKNDRKDEDINIIIHKILKNLHIMEIFDATQFYASIQNLETVLSEHLNISIIIFDTLVAYYWSEQVYRVRKMDTYIQNIIKLIQKVSRDHKPVIIYSRPNYFITKQDGNAVSKNEQIGEINYRVKINHISNYQNENRIFQVVTTTRDSSSIKIFTVLDNKIKWQN